MSLRQTLDATGEDMPQLDAGNQLPPGWYRAELDNVTFDVKSEGTLVFTFRVVTGPYAGVKTSERLWDPLNSSDTDTARRLNQRRLTFAVRLGLVEKGAGGQKLDVDWHDALGVACAIKMVERKDKEGVLRCNVDWAGVYPLTDERVPVAVRGAPIAGAQAKAPAAPGRRPAPPAAVDYGDI